MVSGISIMDCETFDVIVLLEIDRGAQDKHYDFGGSCRGTAWCRASGGCHPSSRTASCRTTCLSNKYGHRVHFWMRARRHVQTIDLGANHQMALEVRPAHDPIKEYGFLGSVSIDESGRLDLDLVARRRHIPL